MTIKSLPLAALLLTCMASTALADSYAESVSETVQSAGSSKLDQPLSGSGQDAKGNPIPTVQFSADQSSSDLTVKASWKGPSHLFDQIAVTGAVPLTSGATAVDLGSLDTMANGAWIGLNTSNAMLLGHRAIPTEATYQRQAGICTELWNRIDAGGAKADRSKPCTPMDLSSYPDLERQYESLFFTPDTMVLLWGVTGKVGYQQYKYFQPATLAANTLQSAPWSVGGYLALQPNVVPNSLVTVSYQHQYGYNPGSGKVACPPGAIGGKGCVDGTIGPPPAQTKELFTLDLKQRFSELLGLPYVNFAVELTPSYDTRSKVWAIDAPLYFISDGKGGFSGGLDVSWRSDKHETIVGVFLSKPFNLAG